MPSSRAFHAPRCRFRDDQNPRGIRRRPETRETQCWIACPQGSALPQEASLGPITQGWKRQRPEFFEANPYICRGISGQTTPQMLLRFRQDVIDLAPDIVVILAGTNDIAGNTGPSTLNMITGNIFSMVELAQANNIKVILCSVLPANAYRWRPEIEPADTIIELNKLLKTYAKKNKIPYVDYFSPMVDKEKGLKKEYSGDGVHPNQKGYTVMEPLIKNEIDKVLKKG